MIDVHELNSVEWPNTKKMPSVPAVYLVYDEAKQIQYVGKTKNLKRRWFSHHKKEFVEQLIGARIAWIPGLSEDCAIALEKQLIKDLQPPLNERGKNEGRADRFSIDLSNLKAEIQAFRTDADWERMSLAKKVIHLMTVAFNNQQQKRRVRDFLRDCADGHPLHQHDIEAIASYCELEPDVLQRLLRGSGANRSVTP